MKRRLIKTVRLDFFEDEGGNFGLCHHNTQDQDNGFDAFWHGMGIFHDVFEHSHEHENKYFKGDYAMNVGGEMAAMGSMWYYYNQMHMSNRLNNSGGMYTSADSMRLTTQDEIQQSIVYGYPRFGYTLESNVPKQKPSYDGELE